MGRAYASDHVLIVHFPSAARVTQLIDEIQSDPEHAKREIIIVSDQIEKLPFTRQNVLFVHGSSLAVDTHANDFCTSYIIWNSHLGQRGNSSLCVPCRA